MSWKKNLTITTALVGTTAVGIHMINKFIYLSATLDNMLNSNSETYYDWRFGKIYYKKYGEGKPILLIHDLTTCSSAYEWSKVVKKLSETNTVYSVDLLGCGRSDKPNLTYTNFLYVQMITDFIKHIIGNKTDVIVTGESSSFVLGACHNDDSIIDKIILVNPGDIKELSRIPSKRSKIASKLINVPIIGTLLYNILTTRNEICRRFHREYYYNSNNIDSGMVKTYYETAHSGNASSKYLFSSLKGYYMTANIPHYLDGLNNSIFILTGEEIPQNNLIAKEYKDIMPSIEILNLKDTKHLPQLEEPDEFINQVKILFNDDSDE